MFEKIIPELVKGKGKTEDEGEERLIIPDGREAKLDEKRFSAITPKALDGCVLFVDAGNAPVFESPAARVEFVRVYGAAYEGTKRAATQREEGFVLIRNVTKDGKGFVEAAGHGVDLQLLIPDDDAELRLGRERVSLAAAAALARFCLECRLARKWGAKLGERCALIVRDGSLLANNSHEEKEFQGLLEKKNVAGLSKTNTLTTTAGNSVSATLLERGPKEPWSYDVGKGTDLSFSVVKLHSRAEHAFRLDCAAGPGALAPATVAAGLAPLATDPIFPGYPYPLVEADRMARVPNRELELLRTRFMMEAGTEWKRLQRLARGSDAHGILDRIS